MHINWKGSLGSISIGKQSSRVSLDEPDLLAGTKGKGSSCSENLKSSGKEKLPVLECRRNRRKGLRKRFHSLTDGIASLLSNDKTKDSTPKHGSTESLKSLQLQNSSDDFICRPFNEVNDGTLYIFDSESRFRKHAGSLTSFLPKSGRPKASEPKTKYFSPPPVDRLKKAPPSPPPRRFSRHYKESRCNIEDPLAEAVVSSSLGHLPFHLRPPAPPPPIRVSKPTSQSSNFFSRTKSTLKLSPASQYTPWKTASTPVTPTNSRSHSPFIRGASLAPPSFSTGNYFDSKHIKCSTDSALSNQSSCVNSAYEKTVSIILEKENGTFGFTVRGGTTSDGIPRPLLVTHVRPGGPADTEGSLKAGDRIVSLDGRDLTRVSLSQAQIALNEVERTATLGIRFDVSIMDSVRYAGGPLLVEIERNPGSPLGIYLNSSKFNNYSIYSSSKNGCNQIFIESMITASIAERCGALAIGDTVCAVNGVPLDRTNLHEVNQILREGEGSKITLEIIPNNKNYLNGAGGGAPSPILSSPSSQRYSLYNTIGPNRPVSTTTRRIQKRMREDNTFSSGRGVGISHPETLRATLLTEGRSVGIALRPPLDSTHPFVAALDPGGAAFKCGVISVGDRILAVNGRNVSGLGISEVNQMMSNTRPTVIIDVEFEVADAVVPSTGTFSVKLSKRHNYLGISVARVKQNKSHEEYILISDIVRGSSAHRSGTLQVGDRLLAIGDSRVDRLTLEETRSLLDVEGDVVTLKVQKDDTLTDDVNAVVYTVQLLRDGESLGISATGTEEPFDPIFVGGIAPGSLAAETGAIHVGDRLLAINDISLRGKPLSEAVRLLQVTQHTVALKVSRPRESRTVMNGLSPSWIGFTPPPPTLSVDSAVESWDSGGLEPSTNALNLTQCKRGSNPDLFESKCESTFQRKQFQTHSDDKDKRHSWNSISTSDSGQSEDKTDWDKMIADLNEISETCGLREKSLAKDESSTSKSNGNLPESSHTWNDSNGKNKSSSEPSMHSFKISNNRAESPEICDEGAYSVSKAAAIHRATTPSSNDIGNSSPVISLKLTKDPFYEDFGFSVSDGLYEKGVYVNKIRKGGPADKSSLLFPFDRILQVNDAQTEDFDCCLTVPLIASADETLFLRVTRQNRSTEFRLAHEFGYDSWDKGDQDNGLNSCQFTKEFL